MMRDRRTERARAVFQSSSHRASAGRRRRSDFRLIDDTRLNSFALLGRRRRASRRRATAQPERDGSHRHRHLAADQYAQHQSSRPCRARRRQNAQALKGDFVDVRRYGRQRHRAQDSRHPQRRQPADRAPHPRAKRGRRGARHRDHRDDRRKGLRRQRCLSARRRARSVFCRIFRLQPFHPDGHPFGRMGRGHALAAAHGIAQPL